MNRETKARSILKSFSWRIVASLTTVLLVYLVTGSLEGALTVGGIEVVVKMIVYFFHERAWDAVPFGIVSESGPEGLSVLQPARGRRSTDRDTRGDRPDESSP